MKKEKLKLNDLKVKSFTTDLGEKTAHTIQGGLISNEPLANCGGTGQAQLTGTGCPGGTGTICSGPTFGDAACMRTFQSCWVSFVPNC